MSSGWSVIKDSLLGHSGTDLVQRFGEVARGVTLAWKAATGDRGSKWLYLSSSHLQPLVGLSFFDCHRGWTVTPELPQAPGWRAGGELVPGGGGWPPPQFQWPELPGSLLVGPEAQTTGDRDVPNGGPGRAPLRGRLPPGISSPGTQRYLPIPKQSTGHEEQPSCHRVLDSLCVKHPEQANPQREKVG